MRHVKLKPEQRAKIGDRIWIKNVTSKTVEIGIEAPEEMAVVRGEGKEQKPEEPCASK